MSLGGCQQGSWKRRDLFRVNISTVHAMDFILRHMLVVVPHVCTREQIMRLFEFGSAQDESAGGRVLEVVPSASEDSVKLIETSFMGKVLRLMKSEVPFSKA